MSSSSVNSSSFSSALDYFIPKSSEGKLFAGIAVVGALAFLASKFFSKSKSHSSSYVSANARGAYASCDGAVATNGGTITATAIGSGSYVDASGTKANGGSLSFHSISSGGSGGVSAIAISDNVSLNTLRAVLGVTDLKIAREQSIMCSKCVTLQTSSSDPEVAINIREIGGKYRIYFNGAQFDKEGVYSYKKIQGKVEVIYHGPHKC